MTDRTTYFNTLLRIAPNEHLKPADRRHALALLREVDTAGLARARIVEGDCRFAEAMDKMCRAAAARWATDQMRDIGEREPKGQMATILRECRGEA